MGGAKGFPGKLFRLDFFLRLQDDERPPLRREGHARASAPGDTLVEIWSVTGRGRSR
jgi:hypothetical protein